MGQILKAVISKLCRYSLAQGNHCSQQNSVHFSLRTIHYSLKLPSNNFQMAKQLPSLTPELTEFIQNQKLFFVATAASDGRINLSPKGLDGIRVTGPNEVVWLNLTGSGNETAAHLLKNNRMTIMFCAFEGKPLILRMYGTAEIFHPRDEEFQEKISLFEGNPGARQIIVLKVELVQTSCGFGVPLMEYQGNRTLLTDWAKKKGKDGVEDYWRKKNTRSIDGFETGILENEQ